ncbi:hypothetical protein E4U14_007675 [Claviceps sp. LM454 group G7]|nr:hypothetical protein E4U14_007675 [Claviceps sp. LM454 group G7]
MSPPRRRSARLASVNAAKNRATPDLASVAEVNETPSRRSSRRVTGDTSVPPTIPEPTTPVSSAVKPPSSEMHPSQFRPSTGAPSSALGLGFSDIPKDGRGPNGLDRTPSKISGVPSSDFTFRIGREAIEADLNTDAQRMLHEIRDQAAKIKATLVAEREAEDRSDAGERRIARPRGKAGRFSAAHMAEFKKMDSIEGHASAWRAQEGRFIPAKAVKRTPSKVDLDATPTSQRTVKLRSTGPVDQEESPNARPKPSLKRKSSAANLDSDRDIPAVSKRQNANRTPAKFSTAARAPPSTSTSAAKRVKQRQDDDAATTRPQPLVAPPLSKPSSVFSRLATSPRKAPLALSPTRTKLSIKPTPSLALSPSKASMTSPPKHPSMRNLTSTASTGAELKRRIISPRSFGKVRSILGGPKSSSEDAKSAIPAPQVSQTPDAPRVQKELLPVPFTTPRRVLKRVTFTPDVVSTLNAQASPSPHRASNMKLRPALRTIETKYAALDEVLAQPSPSRSIYPDLSPLKHLLASPARRAGAASPCRSGTFTFRSDHTIKFADPASAGFGASPGQSGVRHVSGLAGAQNIPGSFPDPPASPSSDPNKENQAPSSSMKVLSGTAHGMQNKKRHRATSEDDDFDSPRAAKKRRNEIVPEGQDLLAPRLAKAGMRSATKGRVNGFARSPKKGLSDRTPGRSMVGTPARASPTKKVGSLSMDRLNMLARPKNRA